MPPSKPGRPRGSGAVFTIPAVELAHSEAAPFRAGYRLGPVSGDKWTEYDWLYRNVAMYLSPAERRAMIGYNAADYIRWVMIGLMQWHIDQVITKVRGR